MRIILLFMFGGENIVRRLKSILALLVVLGPAFICFLPRISPFFISEHLYSESTSVRHLPMSFAVLEIYLGRLIGCRCPDKSNDPPDKSPAEK